MVSIGPVIIQAAIGQDSKAQTFTFSPEWSVLGLILNLPADQIAVLNISFFVADAEFLCEDLLASSLVLRYMRIDSRSLLEQQPERLQNLSLIILDYGEICCCTSLLGRL